MHMYICIDILGVLGIAHFLLINRQLSIASYIVLRFAQKAQSDPIIISEEIIFITVIHYGYVNVKKQISFFITLLIKM